MKSSGDLASAGAGIAGNSAYDNRTVGGCPWAVATVPQHINDAAAMSAAPVRFAKVEEIMSESSVGINPVGRIIITVWALVQGPAQVAWASRAGRAET